MIHTHVTIADKVADRLLQEACQWISTEGSEMDTQIQTDGA